MIPALPLGEIAIYFLVANSNGAYDVSMDVQSITAYAGIAAFLVTMAEIPLWFIHFSGPPTTKNVLARTFLAIFVPPLLIVFLVGSQQIVSDADPSYAWLANVSLLSGVVASALMLVAHSMQVGSILGKDKPVDPTTIGSGGESALTIYGPIGHLLMATFISTGSIALVASGLVPMWVGLVGGAIAAFQLALVPTLFSRTDPAYFYSINGWNIPISGGLMVLWLLMVSILLLV